MAKVMSSHRASAIPPANMKPRMPVGTMKANPKAPAAHTGGPSLGTLRAKGAKDSPIC